MAHERIASNDIVSDVIVHWNDDGMVVDLGFIWDDPQGCAEGPATSDAKNMKQGGETSGVIERQVEGGVGGMIAVPVEPAGLQPYLDAEGRWSIYMAFDRSRVNHLIRTLRRARNKAFGADE